MEKFLLICIVLISVIIAERVYGSKFKDISKQSREKLDSLSEAQWREFLELGVDSINKISGLETNLLNSNIVVSNSSLSFITYLDTLPNREAGVDNEVASKILRASQFVYNSQCVQNGVTPEDCAAYLEQKRLPSGSVTSNECKQIVQGRRNGHHPFRRLLPRNYKDGLYEMFSEDKLPSPRSISRKALSKNDKSGINLDLDDTQSSLSIVQWTQFIEHDLSKTVVPLMDDEHPIECCNEDNFKLLPRYNHPACAPLLEKDTTSKYGRDRCLNYVRSALAVGSSCTFGAVEQLNQATANLDLSQLYGFTEESQMEMRSYKNGEIESVKIANKDFLPAAKNPNSFCAFKNKNESFCFMAGDTRVNSNCFTIVIYTIFLRNHNKIARKLKAQYKSWDDERLFQTAKAINVEIYRKIVFHEWLPTVLGAAKASEINNQPLRLSILKETDLHISNEFAVASVRFYYSMMPNALNSLTKPNRRHRNPPVSSDLFVLKDEIYKPGQYTPEKLDEILESILHQRAMKMDGWFVDGLIANFTNNQRPSHADTFAFDIQRGRDHGLQGYVKYVQHCSNVKIDSWKDLEYLISIEEINKLKSIYETVFDIDLIVGGMSEKPYNGGIIGATFTCLLGEQFAKIQQIHNVSSKSTYLETLQSINLANITAADILCANSDLKTVPRNIFQVVSDSNPLISCDTRVEIVLLSSN